MLTSARALSASCSACDAASSPDASLSAAASASSLLVRPPGPPSSSSGCSSPLESTCAPSWSMSEIARSALCIIAHAPRSVSVASLLAPSP
eukprot:6527888-Prymnesium_polylepis.1